MLLLLSVFCRAQSPGERQISTIYTAKQDAPSTPADTTFYYLVKLKHPAAALHRNLHLLKKLAPNQYIVSSAKPLSTDDELMSANPANALWKATDDLAKLSADHPKATRTITVVLKQATPAAIAQVNKLGTVTQLNGNTVTVKIALKQLPQLLQQNDVVFAASVRKAHPELVINDLDLGSNNISAIRSIYPDVNGTGIKVSVKEENYDHDDLDLLGRSFTAAPAAAKPSAHATIMATLIGGNGNSFIRGLGAAPLVWFTSSDFARLLPDSLPFFNNNNISVQNHSYGTGIENYYGIEAVAYDRQIYENDTLVHVFSSGNIGTAAPATGYYSGLANRANLSGTFKQAKNVLVVGGTGSTNIAEALSSSGPAYDGRIKPELVAAGEDGTSGAAALVSGTVALLQQAYKKQFGKLPSAALLKSVLINSADDTGTPQPDHKSGYGRLNALEALRTLNDARFKAGSLNAGQTVSYPITVPANCRTFKISLAWNDVPAALNAPYALVNDLDLEVTTPSGQKILPWTLSSFPNADSLLKPAIRQRDTLNNTEQVSLQNPEAGTYTVNITARRVTTPAQAFYLAYQTAVANQFEWTYPVATDQLFAGEDNYLRWQDTHGQATGAISISYDNGINWRPVANADPAGKFYKWTAPNVFDKAILRMDINGQQYTGKPFVIAKPLTLNVGYDCTDGTLLHWNPQPGATGYVIYSIKDNVLQKLTTAADTTIVIPAQMQTSKFFAVSALGNGFEGIRSLTINAGTQGVGCYVKTLLADVTNNNAITLNLTLGSVQNLKSITWQKLTGTNAYTDLGTTNLTNALAYNFIDADPKKGINYYRAALTTQGNKIIYSDLASAILLQSNQVTLFPNPVTTQLNILTGELNTYELKLYDYMGRLSLKKEFNGLQNIIPVNLQPGVYACTIMMNGKVIYRGKIIKV